MTTPETSTQPQTGCPCCGSTALILYFCDKHDPLWVKSPERKALLQNPMAGTWSEVWTKATTEFIARIKAQEILETSQKVAA